MTVEEIKEKLNHYVGNEITIKCNMGRNKYEKYNAIIKDLYKNIFTVEVTKENNIVLKSFTYSDIITKTIRIDYNK